MAEYFDISIIGKKTNSSRLEMNACLNQFELSEGENDTELFGGRQIIVTFIDNEETDFEEVSIGLPEQYFHKDSFEGELSEFTDFITKWFKYNANLKYALCSYELNGYIIGRTKKLQDFNDDLLKRFPIVYKRTEFSELPALQTNLEAQEIFA